MKIFVDLTSLADNFSGIERFALSITQELVKHTEHTYILAFKNEVHPLFRMKLPNVRRMVIRGGNKLVFAQIVLPLKRTIICSLRSLRHFSSSRRRQSVQSMM